MIYYLHAAINAHWCHLGWCDVDITGWYGVRASSKETSGACIQYCKEVSEFWEQRTKVMVNMMGRFLQGPEIPERQLYKEPPEAFLEADNLEVNYYKAFKRYSIYWMLFREIQTYLQMYSISLKVFGRFIDMKITIFHMICLQCLWSLWEAVVHGTM